MFVYLILGDVRIIVILSTLICTLTQFPILLLLLIYQFLCIKMIHIPLFIGFRFFVFYSFVLLGLVHKCMLLSLGVIKTEFWNYIDVALIKSLLVIASFPRNNDFREVTLEVDGETVLRFALAYGFRNIQNLVQKLKRGKSPYHYVEVMACPSGKEMRLKVAFTAPVIIIL